MGSDERGRSGTNVRQLGRGSKPEKKGVPGVILRGVDAAIDDVNEAIESVSAADHRVEIVGRVYDFLDQLEEQFCLHCGQEPPHEENEMCPAALDGDDEDDGEESGGAG